MNSFDRFTYCPEGAWAVTEQEMKCMIQYHGTEWLKHAIKADVFFYVYDAARAPVDPDIKYIADNYSVWESDNKMSFFPKDILANCQYDPVKKVPKGSFRIMTMSELGKGIKDAGGIDEFVSRMRAQGFDAIGLLPDDWKENGDREVFGTIDTKREPRVGFTEVTTGRASLAGYTTGFTQALYRMVESITKNNPLYVVDVPEQKDVVPKNRPKGPHRSKNQRGAWWNK